MQLMRSIFMLALAMPLLASAAGDPPNLEPLPEAPPPPPGLDNEVGEPEVTIIKRGGDTIEEYRINGQLYMMKVTPAHGVPYYLTKESEDEGSWARSTGPTPPLSVPKWVLFRF